MSPINGRAAAGSFGGYVPEIDGLRAVAVVAVFLYHLKLAPFAGGFVGVDIFFVISGYLITGIIARGLETGTFSFFDFYARRFRRIYPALVVVVLVTAIAYGMVAAPSRVQELGETAVATILSVSNIFFWLTSSYFDPTIEQNPLLHTWSLGVEEQFYLFWPVALLAAVKLRLVLPFLVASLLLGLGASEYMVRTDATAAFYLTPFRIFQFAAGGLIYCSHSRGWLMPRWLANAAFTLGLAAALLPIFIFDGNTAFPGLNALLPTLGAALVIGARDARPVSLILGNPAAAFVGRLSYSLYLTHWPAIVIYRQAISPEIGLGDAAIIVLMATAAAVGLHYMVERPARNAGPISGLHLRPATLINISGAVVALGLAGSFVMTSGWTWRFPSSIIVTQDELAAQRSRYWESRPASLQEASKPKIAIIGDSHAIDLYYALH